MSKRITTLVRGDIVREELIRAALSGIHEYLRTTRGAAICGSGVTTEIRGRKFIVHCTNDDKDNVGFDVSIW